MKLFKHFSICSEKQLLYFVPRFAAQIKTLDSFFKYNTKKTISLTYTSCSDLQHHTRLPQKNAFFFSPLQKIHVISGDKNTKNIWYSILLLGHQKQVIATYRSLQNFVGDHKTYITQLQKHFMGQKKFQKMYSHIYALLFLLTPKKI